MATHYIIRQSLWRQLLWLSVRWNVYEMGHTEGDETWLAAFRDLQEARNWTGQAHLEVGERSR